MQGNCEYAEYQSRTVDNNGFEIVRAVKKLVDL